MNTGKTFRNNNERFASQRVSRRAQAVSNRFWREETPKRSASRSKVTVTKKIMKMEKPQMKYGQSKRKQFIRKTPGSPHNTTQYIINAGNSFIETSEVEMGQDRLSFDFRHHDSAGSMMELMGNFFTQMHAKCTNDLSTGFTSQEESINPLN